MISVRRRSVIQAIAVLFLALGCLGAGRGALTEAHGATPATALLVGVRAAHAPGHDRVIFDFSGGPPGRWTVRYVNRLIADPRGTPIPIAGRAILAVTFHAAAAHTDGGRVTAPARATFALPNVMTVARAGDFEAVLSYGIGLARRTSFRVFALRRPNRVVIDIATGFRTVPMRVYLFNERRFVASTPPFVTGVRRQITAAAPATALMDRLFAGPTSHERASGLRLLSSRATGFAGLSIVGGIARIRLTGGCSSGGSTATIAEEISTTLRQLPTVHWVKIYDPSGHTERPSGPGDSIPECLEP